MDEQADAARMLIDRVAPHEPDALHSGAQHIVSQVVFHAVRQFLQVVSPFRLGIVGDDVLEALDVFVYEAREGVWPLGDGTSQAVRPGFPFTLFSLCLYLVSRIVAAHESREPVEFGEDFFPCLR